MCEAKEKKDDEGGGAREKKKGLLGYFRIHSLYDPYNLVQNNFSLKLQNNPFSRIPFYLITHGSLRGLFRDITGTWREG